MAVHLGKLECFYLLTRVCEASLADITPVEVNPLLFGCEYMTQGKRTLTVASLLLARKMALAAVPGTLPSSLLVFLLY